MNKKLVIFSAAMALAAALAGCMPANQNGGGNPDAGNQPPSNTDQQKIPLDLETKVGRTIRKWKLPSCRSLWLMGRQKL